MTTKDKIRKLCRERGTNANKLEKELGLSQGYISKLSATVPSGNKLQKIADYFDVSTNEILGDDIYRKYEEQSTYDSCDDIDEYINNILGKLKNHSGSTGAMYFKGVQLTDVQIDMLADDLQNALNRVMKLSERSKSE